MKIEIDGKGYIEKTTQKNRNSGYRNSGNWNSGNWNSGYRNSGYSNSGNRNSGSWNSGNRNSGYLNIDEPFLRIFGKETKFKSADIGIKLKFPDYFYFDLTEFVDVSDMAEDEKKEHLHYPVTTGFLRVYKYKEAWKRSFDKASKEDVKLTLKIPNFDYKMFEEISGITEHDIKKKIVRELEKREVNGNSSPE